MFQNALSPAFDRKASSRKAGAITYQVIGDGFQSNLTPWLIYFKCHF